MAIDHAIHRASQSVARHLGRKQDHRNGHHAAIVYDELQMKPQI